MSKEKLFPQPTKIGTKIYAYSRYGIEGAISKVYDIVHLNSEGNEELLKSLNFHNQTEEKIKYVLHEEVNSVTDIFDIGSWEGQRRLREKSNELLK